MIERELLGEKHPSTASSFNNIGANYAQMGDYKSAMEYHEQALRIARELLGEKHPSTAASLNNIGLTYAYIGDYERSLEYHEHALEIQRELIGDTHPDTVLSLLQVVDRLMILGKLPEAFDLLNDLPDLPKDHKHYDRVRLINRQLLSKPLRPGFRQPANLNRRHGRRKRKGSK